MSGSVEVFADYTGPVIDRADVVVVGSGPCGAVAAYELALAGKDVVLLEEGPPFTPAEFELDGALSMARTMREGGLRFTTGFVMPTMQAIALGGGSLVNSAICGRCPEFRLQEWADAADLDHTSRRELEPHYDAIAGFLGIAPTPDDVQGPRNLLFRDGCKVLGWSSEPCTRNVVGCRGSGECFTGCRAGQAVDGHLLRAGGDPRRRPGLHLGAGAASAVGRSSRHRYRGTGGGAVHRRPRRLGAHRGASDRAGRRRASPHRCCCGAAAISPTRRSRSARTSSSIPALP